MTSPELNETAAATMPSPSSAPNEPLMRACRAVRAPMRTAPPTAAPMAARSDTALPSRPAVGHRRSYDAMPVVFARRQVVSAPSAIRRITSVRCRRRPPRRRSVDEVAHPPREIGRQCRHPRCHPCPRAHTADDEAIDLERAVGLLHSAGRHPKSTAAWRTVAASHLLRVDPTRSDREEAVQVGRRPGLSGSRGDALRHGTTATGEEERRGRALALAAARSTSRTSSAHPAISRIGAANPPTMTRSACGSATSIVASLPESVETVMLVIAADLAM